MPCGSWPTGSYSAIPNVRYKPLRVMGCDKQGLRIRSLFFLPLLLASLWAVPTEAQDSLSVEALMNSLSDGDEETLLAWAGPRVELALLGQRRRYTRAQATHVLRDFFQRYPPEDFQVDHSLSQQEEWWLTGSFLIRYNGERMRVYLRFRGTYPVYQLLAIQIIRE